MLAMGLNGATQGLSCCVIDPDCGQVVYRDDFNYGAELADKYGLRDGFMDSGTGWVHAPPLMYADSVDLAFQRLRRGFPDVARIGSIAGATQQHATVYLNGRAKSALRQLNPAECLADQLRDVFSRSTSPIWRDTSTQAECRLLADALGGAQAVAELTGSVPTRRFACSQILRFHGMQPDSWQNTSMVGLLSSLFCSLLIGDLAPIDYCEGSGMNLLRLRDFSWSSEVLDSFRQVDIGSRLPPLVPSAQCVGTISPYYAKYGFSNNTKVIAFSGDNADSLLGTGVHAVDQDLMVMSFGTSDTAFRMLPQATHDPDGFGNVFGAVTGGYFGLTCTANASLTRQAIRDRYTLSWEDFSAILRATPPGNCGRIMLPFLVAEITPQTKGSLERYFGGLDRNDREGCVRGVVEGQLLNLLQHCSWMGGQPRAIRATGGASANREIMQICADVFNVPIQQFDSTDSVSLGAALRAAKGAKPEYDWAELTDKFCRPTAERILPLHPDAYGALKPRFRECLADALARSTGNER